MDGRLGGGRMEDIIWWQWLLILCSVIATIVVLRFVVKFDVVEWKKSKRDRLQSSLKFHCPHVHITEENGTFPVDCLITSPPGTTRWVCSRCGQVFLDDEIVEKIHSYYANNPDAYIKKMKKLKRITKKLHG